MFLATKRCAAREQHGLSSLECGSVEGLGQHLEPEDIPIQGEADVKVPNGEGDMRESPDTWSGHEP